MKFQILIPSSVASAYVLVGVLSSFVLDMTKAATYNAPVLPSPICITFDPILMKGDAEFVNTDSSPSTVPTTGDFTIGEKYQAVSGQGVPNQSGGFVDISLEFKSVCVVTRNQPPLSSFASSPSCQYEFDMRFCRNSHSNCRQGTFSAHGSGPDKIRIAGGADDFFGAFGQIATTSDFNPGTIQSNGDLKDSTVGLKIELCYYDVPTAGTPTKAPTPSPTPFNINPTVSFPTCRSSGGLLCVEKEEIGPPF